MLTKTLKLMEHLERGNLNLFDVQSTGDADVLRHTETINGFTINSLIIIDNSVCTETIFVIAQCSNIMKHEQLHAFLNQLNCQKKLKYCLREDGAITASMLYWANDEEFNPNNLLTLYVSFLNSLTESTDINKIMKIIWA